MAPLIAFLVPLAMYIVQARRFGRWIVDDAGITFAYARSLVDGHGLVQQPGAPPVEGYSNPFWLLLLALGKLLHLFDSGTTLLGLPDYVWFPKLLGILGFAATLGAYYAASIRVLGAEMGCAVTGFAGSLLALHPSYVGWTTSGLENSLYGALTAALALHLAAAVHAGHLFSARVAGTSGALAGLAAWTRPDGLIYLGAYPLTAALLWRPRQGARLRGPLLAWLAAFGPLAIGLLTRHAYFGSWLPNPAIAKAQPLPEVDGLERIAHLSVYVGWPFSTLSTLMVGAALADRGSARSGARFAHVLGAAALPLLLALLAFAVLRRDWMVQQRFATPVWTIGAFVVSIAAARLIGGRAFSGIASGALLGLFVAACALAVRQQRANMTAFVKEPTVSLCMTADFYRLFHAYADRLGIRSGSLLLADLGGSLLTQRHFLIDAAGLTNATIARGIRDGDRRGMANFVLESARPTFVQRHGVYARWLARDHRFARDYVAIVADTDFVRRDAVTDPSLLERLRPDAERWVKAVDAYYRRHPRAACGEVLRPGSLPEPRVVRITH